jgi:hypothetical protein
MTLLVKNRQSSRRLARTLAIVALVRELSTGVLSVAEAPRTPRRRNSHVLGALDTQFANAEPGGGGLEFQ